MMVREASARIRSWKLVHRLFGGTSTRVSSLLAPLFASLFVMGLLVYVGVTGLDRVSRQAQAIVDQNLENSVRISDIDARTRALNGEFYQLMSRRAANVVGVDVQNEIGMICRDVEQLIGDLDDYENARAPDTSKSAIRDAIRQLQEYKQALEFVGSMLEMDFASAVTFIQPFNGLFENLSNLLRDMKELTVIEAHRLTAQASAQTGETTRLILYISLLVAIGVLGFAWSVGRRHQRFIFTTQVL